MRYVLLMGAVVLSTASQSAAPRTPVLVELFTSEGCSSCPPADTLLSTLARKQPVPGAEVVPLELHVTYWDDLGWKDPASLPQATARQQSYARAFGTDNIYTPQAIIDGMAEVVGSDEAAIRRAVAKAAIQPHVPLTLAGTLDGLNVNAAVTLGRRLGDREAVDLLVAVLEDGVTSAVARGENTGRTLHHDAVVRAITVTAVDATADSVHTRVWLDPRWPRTHLRLVAALQARSSGRILGAAVTPLQ